MDRSLANGFSAIVGEPFEFEVVRSLARRGATFANLANASIGSGSTAFECDQIGHALPTDATGVLDIKVPVVNGEATPYVKMGNWPAILWALAMLVIGFVTTLVTKRSKINKFDA